MTGNKCVHQLIDQVITLGQGWECRYSRVRKDHHNPILHPSPPTSLPTWLEALCTTMDGEEWALLSPWSLSGFGPPKGS